MANSNSFVRVTRVSKLYRIIKITRLFRLFKVVKHKSRVTKKVDKIVKVGAGQERFLFFLVTLILVCHFIGCLWIYQAKLYEDDEDTNTSTWIKAMGFENKSNGELYALSVYFTMQTLTTVGYGDITVANTTERFMCIFL